MNWPMAKTILIIALLATNLFLLFTYGGFKLGSSDSFKDTRALSEFLAKKNIYVNADRIPLKNNPMPVLYVHNEDRNCVSVSVALNETVRRAGGDGDEDYKKAADSFVGALGQKYGTAVFSGVERDGNFTRVKYSNAVNNVRIEESYIICIFNGEALEDVACNWLEVIGIHNKPQDTVSASQSLLLFMAQRETGKSVYIDNIEMVYWLDESVEIEAPVSEDTALPVWKITYNGGDFDYIDAYVHN